MPAACGGSKDPDPRTPQVGVEGEEQDAAGGLGFPAFATKNTTRVGGADPVADAAAVAQAVYPATDTASRPKAVTLVDKDDWQAGIAASSLIAEPIGAPVLPPSSVACLTAACARRTATRIDRGPAPCPHADVLLSAS